MGAQVRRGIPRFLASVPVLGCLQCLSEPRQGPRPNGARERLLPPPLRQGGMLRWCGCVQSSSGRAGAQAWQRLAERTRTHWPKWTRGLWTLRGAQYSLALWPFPWVQARLDSWANAFRDHEATTGRMGCGKAQLRTVTFTHEGSQLAIRTENI